MSSVVEAVQGREVKRAVDWKLKFYKFLQDFRDSAGVFKYRERIFRMTHMMQKSLVVDFSDVILYDRELARHVEEEPDQALEEFSSALMEYLEKEQPEYKEVVGKVYVRIRQPPRVLKIRELTSDYIGKFVAVEGIVTRVTRVEAKLVKAHYIHVTPDGDTHEFDFPEHGEMGERIEKPVVCPVCGRTGRFEIDLEKSKFVDWQKVVVQERPEEIPPGQIPRSIEVVLTGDLVDSARPGDRALITGVLRVMPTQAVQKAMGRSVFSFYIEANHVDVQQKVLEEIEITREDEEKIRELARDPWVREKIVASIAPSIYGYHDIKEAIALLLFGGVPKVMPDGTRIRGDIHVLLVGDPGTAKSQLLQYTARIAPRGIYTSGKGSTAAGLTATVLRDKTTGEYYLEAGAMVIADGGVAAIDEIDKMREEDRSAIHEALEQQTVSIAKAGIVARLNARASVLAAGNPRFGRYDLTQPISKNIDLPPTILSRFDLIFVIQDVPLPEKDRRLARHILGVHSDIEKAKPFIDPQLLKKYVSYARKYVRPQLTPEAMRLIEEFYVAMRKGGIKGEDLKTPPPIAITPRQLEGLIRLAEAHAKMALKDKVTIEDVEEAIRLMYATLRKVGFDIESKTIDIDVLETGVSRSKREKMKEFVRFLNETFEQVPEIEVSQLVKLAREKGFEKDFVYEMIQYLKNSGELYEPMPGKLAKTSRY
ncbi:MCM family protein [Thermogladius calderae 1633]|uniref:DNA helicase n=1 Tax=Thermogladius calderae (strain DSM 22663 / VKM B-2946 / 1633) TaxID=1184251 RepID=I3TCL8_THEC1|nr:MCM family protein [Thermogladius calderae 1633]